MRLVPTPAHRPHVCALTLRGTDPEGFFTANTVIRELDPVAYISVTAVRQMADKLGYPDTQQVDELKQQIAALERQVESLEADLAEADKQLTAIDALESAGFVARKKPGRPKTRQEA